MSETQHEATEPVEDTDQDQDQLEAEQVEDDQSSEDQQDEDQDDQDFDRERTLKKLRKLNSENRNLRKAKKEAEEQASQAGKDSERAKTLEAVNARYEALADNDLPLQLAKWISATESEEILEQAEELLSLGGSGRKAPPSNTPKERINKSRVSSQSSDEIGDLDDFAEKIFKN